LFAVIGIKRPYAINQTGQTAKLAFHQFDWATQQQVVAIETFRLMIIKMGAELKPFPIEWERQRTILSAALEQPTASPEGDSTAAGCARR
jgi:hypothetical protein